MLKEIENTIIFQSSPNVKYSLILFLNLFEWRNLPFKSLMLSLLS